MEVSGIFGFHTVETQKHGRKEIKPMPQEKKIWSLQTMRQISLKDFG